MLRITVPVLELFNEHDSSFTTLDGCDLELEHSLLSVSKWESKFHKAFLGPGEKSEEEVLAYIEAMILTPVFPPEVCSRLTQSNLADIHSYIESSHSATTFNDRQRPGRRSETVTSELIYYWMVSFNIPFECENWHLNRLLTLIRICNVKQSKPKKMPPSELARSRHELNEQRKAQLNTQG